MKIGIAADHGGYELKQFIYTLFKDKGFDIKDFGAFSLNTNDDYPDFVIPLAIAVSEKEIDRGIAVCGSGVGACIVANKIKGVRACLINDHFSAHQGVEDDDMNIICLGGRISGHSTVIEFVEAFLSATFSGAERHVRRLMKITSIEK